MKSFNSSIRIDAEVQDKIDELVSLYRCTGFSVVGPPVHLCERTRDIALAIIRGSRSSLEISLNVQDIVARQHKGELNQIGNVLLASRRLEAAGDYKGEALILLTELPALIPAVAFYLNERFEALEGEQS